MDDNPFQSYRAEWLHKREVFRQQRRVRKLAKLQAKETKLNQRLMEGKPSIWDYFKELRRRRLLRKQQELEWLRERTDFHPIFLWLKEGGTKYFLFGACVLMALFGYVLWQKQMHIRRLYSKLADSRTVLVRVGDEEILKGNFETRLWDRNANRELPLETLLLIYQKATENIDVNARQYRTLADEQRSSHVLSLSEEVAFLEEKYLLSKIEPAEKSKFFQEKKEELALLQLSSIRFEDVPHAEQFLDAFQKGRTPERAAETYSLDKRSVRLPPVMVGDLERELGVFHERAVRELEGGRYSAPLPTDDGYFVIYRLDRVDSEFRDVLPAINSAFARKGVPDVRKELVEASELHSEEITKEQLLEIKL
jgi:hypothetical protein